MLSTSPAGLAAGRNAGRLQPFLMVILSILFQVEVWESSDRIGGHASTVELPGGLVMNDCVLGGTYSGFSNTQVH